LLIQYPPTARVNLTLTALFESLYNSKQ